MPSIYYSDRIADAAHAVRRAKDRLNEEIVAALDSSDKHMTPEEIATAAGLSLATVYRIRARQRADA